MTQKKGDLSFHPVRSVDLRGRRDRAGPPTSDTLRHVNLSMIERDQLPNLKGKRLVEQNFTRLHKSQFLALKGFDRFFIFVQTFSPHGSRNSTFALPHSGPLERSGGPSTCSRRPGETTDTRQWCRRRKRVDICPKMHLKVCEPTTVNSSNKNFYELYYSLKGFI